MEELVRASWALAEAGELLAITILRGYMREAVRDTGLQLEVAK